MKYLVIDEMSKDDFTKAITSPNLQLHTEEREKGNIPSHVFPDHMLHGDLPNLTESTRFFKIYDADDPKQLANIDALWTVFDAKTWKRWVIPISEMSAFGQAYNEYKKKAK